MLYARHIGDITRLKERENGVKATQNTPHRVARYESVWVINQRVAHALDWGTIRVPPLMFVVGRFAWV